MKGYLLIRQVTFQTRYLSMQSLLGRSYCDLSIEGANLIIQEAFQPCRSNCYNIPIPEVYTCFASDWISIETIAVNRGQPICHSPDVCDLNKKGNRIPLPYDTKLILLTFAFEDIDSIIADLLTRTGLSPLRLGPQTILAPDLHAALSRIDSTGRQS